MIEMPPCLASDELTTEFVTEKVLTRFRASYVVDGDCWKWTGRVGGIKEDTPHFKLGKKYWVATRFVYFIKNGASPKEFMLHKCDNSICVRPTHLFEGSQSLNMIDCRQKGRHSIGRAVPEEIKAQARLCRSSSDLVRLSLESRYSVSALKYHQTRALAALGDVRALARLENQKRRARLTGRERYRRRRQGDTLDMRQSDSSNLGQHSDWLLPKSSAAIIASFEHLTDAEIRTHAVSALENPVLRWVMVDAYQQAVQSLRMGLPNADVAYQCSVLKVVDQLIGTLRGQAFETRDFPPA
jgi:hypothetical protein